MATLHGILAELGIDTPEMHPERRTPSSSPWITDEKFTPVEGKSYELAFGKIRYGEQEKNVIKRVRIDGPESRDWLDIDEGRPLDGDLRAFMVKAFRQLD